MAVKAGYKQTEVGVIPEDWDVSQFGDNFSVIAGIGFSKSEYTNYGIRLIRIDNVSYGEIQWDSLAYLPNEYKDTYSKALLKEGDILLALNRPITNNQLKIAILKREDTPAILYQRVGRIQILSSNIKILFAYYSFLVYIRKFVEESSVGTDQPFISTVKLKKVRLPIPPTKTEQTAIANALSDADTWIQSLTRLIAKKRQIKQGAMQSLLNPYEDGVLKGGWEVKRLVDIAPLQRGFDLPSSQLERGEYPVVYSNGVLNFHNQKQVAGPGVITGRSGTLGSIHFVTSDYWPHNTTLWATSFNGNVPKFVFYLFKSIGFSRFATGSGVPTLNRNDAHGFSVGIPQNADEQTRIATILSDMDKEISDLEAKLEKAKALKQGMMQNLLTGKIRLVKPAQEAPHANP